MPAPIAERGNRRLRRIDRLLGTILLGTLRERVRRPPPPAPGRIAWIKLGAIGDLLLLTPVLDALRAALPETEIWGVVSPGNASVAERLGLADRWLVIDPVRDLRHPLALDRCLRRAPVMDAALCFEQWSRGTAWMATRLRAGWRAGFWTPGHLHGRGLDWRELHRRDRHEWQNFAALAAPLGARCTAPRLRFPLDEAERRWAGERGFVGAIVLHPGAGRSPRHLRAWPEERFVALGRALQADGEQIVVTRDDGDSAGSEAVARELGAPCVAGELGQIAAGLAAARLVVVANTGLLHLATAVETPVVSPNGPVDPVRFGALGEAVTVSSNEHCSPCLHLGFEYSCPAKPGACMHAIDVEMVYNACCSFLRRIDHPTVDV